MALISSSRRFLVLTALACLAGNHYAGAFAPSKPVFQTSTRLPVSLQEAVTDVSIEYDSAAKLAYSEWREKYSKGDFDAARYESFKANYEALTIANVVAAKKARDEKSETPPRRLDLNEFADMTAEEYMAMQSGETVEAPKVEETEESDESQKVDLLSAAFESTVSQSEAASAIEEAATALAEEEKVRHHRNLSPIILFSLSSYKKKSIQTCQWQNYQNSKIYVKIQWKRISHFFNLFIVKKDLKHSTLYIHKPNFLSNISN